MATINQTYEYFKILRTDLSNDLNNFSYVGEGLFSNLILLEEQDESVSELYFHKAAQIKYDIIIVGTMLALMAQDIGNLSDEQFKAKYGVKEVYPLSLSQLVKASGLKKVYQRELILRIGQQVLIENSIPFDSKIFNEASPISKAFTRCISPERFKEYREQSPQNKVYMRAYLAQEKAHARRRFFWRALAIIAAVISPLSLIFRIKEMKEEPPHPLGKAFRKAFLVISLFPVVFITIHRIWG